jgi:hypothetical protein
MTQYNRMLFVDVELTCWEGSPPGGEVSEVIAFGIVDFKTSRSGARRRISCGRRHRPSRPSAAR